MPIHSLGKHFDSFFGRLNPGSSFEQRAASEHQSIIRLIEDASGLAAKFSPTCYLQGSYKQQTAIYTINDVDIVACCHLPSLPVALWSEQRWKRDELFETIAAPLLADPRSTGTRYTTRVPACASRWTSASRSKSCQWCIGRGSPA